MKQLKVLLILALSILIGGCRKENKKASSHEHAIEKPVTDDKNVLSPHTSAMAMIGDAHIHIDYSSPGVRNRIIFGGLLAYDEVWQAGAHMATWIETDKDLIIEGKELKAGKYGFFAIPSQKDWTLIFNTRWNQHGKDEYNREEDVLRVVVIPETSNQFTEHLTYLVEETGRNQGTITLSWEKLKVQMPLKVAQ